MSRTRILALVAGLIGALTLGPLGAAGATDQPEPGSPGYLARDLGNMVSAYGRVTGPGGQLTNPAYLPALVRASSLLTASQLLAQAATPTRPALNAGNLVPGWNVGNPLRAGWNGTRGRSEQVSFTSRYGALLRGTVYAPLPGATDPYTGAPLPGPFPGVVITPGSVQGSEGMYVWLAQDLAERGYVVLTFDVQGEGTSETLPHTTGAAPLPEALPFCNPFAAPVDGNLLGCPGVPFQQLANFTTGTEDALDFFLSSSNPYAALLDHSADHSTATPGRTTRVAAIGHSMGAFAVSRLQATDPRIETVVALDKLAGPSSPALPGAGDNTDNHPVVPALAVQSEYGFAVTPYPMSGGSSLVPTAGNPDPMRERRTGFEDWRRAGVDSMLVVPRASTHLEYADVPYVLPASRWGQALTSAYVQAWLDRYLKHRGDGGALLDTSLRYLEPRGNGVWAPVTLDRDGLLSFYYCSAYALHTGTNGRGALLQKGDIGDIGGCAR